MVDRNFWYMCGGGWYRLGWSVGGRGDREVGQEEEEGLRGGDGMRGSGLVPSSLSG